MTKDAQALMDAFLTSVSYDKTGRWQSLPVEPDPEVLHSSAIMKRGLVGPPDQLAHMGKNLADDYDMRVGLETISNATKRTMLALAEKLKVMKWDVSQEPRDKDGKWTLGVDSAVQPAQGAMPEWWKATSPSLLGITGKFDGAITNLDDIPFVTQSHIVNGLTKLQADTERNTDIPANQREMAADAVYYMNQVFATRRLESEAAKKEWQDAVAFAAITKDGIVRGAAVGKPVGGNSFKLEFLGSLQHGAGGKLLRQVEDYAVSKGFDGIYLQSSAYARHFYEKNGYKVEPSQFRMYGTHHKDLHAATTIGKDDSEEPCGILAASDAYIDLCQSTRKGDVSNEPRDKDGQWTSADNAHELAVSSPWSLLALNSMNKIPQNEPIKSLLGKIIDATKAQTQLPRMQFINDVGKVVQPVASATQMTAHRCYSNSLDVMLSEVHTTGERTTQYMEGYVTEHGVPLSHAWNAVGDKYIDHTIADPSTHQYMGVIIPRRVLIPIASSGLFSKGYGEGIIGTIMAMKAGKKRDEYLKLIKEANQ